jgi:hypothetical protein
MIELIINYRQTPDTLSSGLLFPIIKDDKGKNDSIDNIRPITLSDTQAIIYEKYILSIIEKEFVESPLQFGFRSTYSTNHAFYTLNETALEHRRKNKTVYICFLDYSKAFDKINSLTAIET